jgi:hypothetical protein
MRLNLTCICKVPGHVHGIGCHYPTTEVVCPRAEFQLTWTHHALDPRVLCVAVSDHGEWAAYVASVPGQRHTEEAEEVARHGSKLPHDIAKLLFPSMEEAYRWRP